MEEIDPNKLIHRAEDNELMHPSDVVNILWDEVIPFDDTTLPVKQTQTGHAQPADFGYHPLPTPGEEV